MSNNGLPRDHPARDFVIRDRAQNLWVEAGAGTGKTTLLVQRVLSLLLDSDHPVRLARQAAITFTEKAAGELKVKIRQEVEKRLADTAFAPQRDELRQALKDLETAAIGTLHSFAALLIKERPVEARIDPQAELLDEQSGKTLLAELYDDWFERQVNAAPPPAVLEWLLRERPYYRRRADHDWLWKLVQRIAADADMLLDAPLPRPGKEVAAERWPQLQAATEDAFDHANQNCTNRDDKGYGQVASFHVALAGVPEPSDWQAFHDALAALPKFHLGGGAKGKWQPEQIARNKQLREELREGVAGLTMLRDDPSVRAMFELARGFVREFEREKARRGVLGFQDLLVTAARMLRVNKEVRDYFQRRFDAVLVDEFQDTDPLQVEIAFFLCEDGARADQAADVALKPGKLMVVGDPKQSIYRFRRADIEVYEHTKRALLEGREPTFITVNFRCAPGIIDTVNRVFADLMELDVDLPASPDYVELETGRTVWPDEAGVTFLVPDEPAETAAQARAGEFAAVARWIKQAHRRGLQVFDRAIGGLRPIRWRDVAILDRRTTEFAGLEQALRKEGVPYRTEGGKVFFRREEIAAAVCGIAAIENPDDTTSLAQWLGSDLVAFTDQDLLRHVLERPDRSLSYLGEVEAATDEVGEALRWMRELHEGRNRSGCAATVRGLFDRFGALPHAYCLPRAEVAVANLHKVLNAARVADREGMTFAEFGREWREAFEEGREEGDFAVTEDADDVVRVMTIHKAKGLAWPVVMLIDLGGDIKSHAKEILFRRNANDLAVHLAKGYETWNYPQMKEHEDAFETAERVRQLYVATTRAQDHLVIPLFGVVKANKAGVVSPQRGYLRFLVQAGVIDDAIDIEDAVGARVEPVAMADLDTDLTRHWSLPQEYQATTIGAAEIKRLQAMATAVASAPQPSPLPLVFVGPSRAGGPPPAGARRHGAEMGSAFHLLMERIDFDDPANDAALSQVVGEFSLTASQAKTLTRWVKNLVAMPSFAAARTGRVWREAPFTWSDGRGVAYSGKIDLLAETDEGLLVVDYKTDGVTEAELPAHMEHYAHQGEVYRAAIKELTGTDAVRMVFCFVDPNREVELP